MGDLNTKLPLDLRKGGEKKRGGGDPSYTDSITAGKGERIGKHIPVRR